MCWSLSWFHHETKSPQIRRPKAFSYPSLEMLESRLSPSVNVLTYHNDLTRSGANLEESVLTPASVYSANFGRLFSYNVDGQVFAQPLYVSNVNLPDQTTHNVVFVATEHDSVFAFDADNPAVGRIWQDRFIDPAHGVTTVPAVDTLEVNNITPEIGITGTPVIDAGSGTLYVVAITKEVSGNGPPHYLQRLHALDLATGQEKFGGPAVIGDTIYDGVNFTYVNAVSVPGTGDGSIGGIVFFNALREGQRSGLVLSNGVAYVSWASHGDYDPYHGWVIGFDAKTLLPVSVFNTSPNAGMSGIWMSGAAPAVDSDGNLYLVTGNGLFDVSGTQQPAYGDSILKLSTSNGLAVTDYFTPWNQADLNSMDLDLGSGGVMLLPDQPGPYPHLLLQSSKEGKVYLLNRDDLGHYQRSGSASDDIVQELAAGTIAGGTWSAPALFNDMVYYQGAGDVLKAFQLSHGQLSTTPVSSANRVFGYPGATPSISANGSSDGIVWVLYRDAAILFAFDANNLSELYNSDQAPDRDQLTSIMTFAVPTIANGHVYVGTGSSLDVFGLLGRGGEAVPARSNRLHPPASTNDLAIVPGFTFPSRSTPGGPARVAAGGEPNVGYDSAMPIRPLQVPARTDLHEAFDAPLRFGTTTGAVVTDATTRSHAATSIETVELVFVQVQPASCFA
jgi:hypothetical protein